MKPQPFWKRLYPLSPFLTTGLIFLLNVLFLWTGIWQLTFMVIIIISFLAKSSKMAILTSILGNFMAWMGFMLWYLIRFNVIILLSQVFEIITGIPNAGGYLVLVNSIIAIILGYLGGYGGYYIGQLLWTENNEKSTE